MLTAILQFLESLGTLTTQMLRFLGLNRNSVTLFWFKWTNFIIGLAALGGQMSKLGIPEQYHSYIALAAFFLSMSSAQHRTSALSKDGDQ